MCTISRTSKRSSTFSKRTATTRCVNSARIIITQRASPAAQVDSARTYTGGTSEEYLGKIDWKKRGLVMDTKLYPNIVSSR